MNVGQIFSVESDADFARSVVRSVRRTDTGSVVTMRTVNIGETAKWGMPVNRDRSNKWSGYSLDVWTDLAAKDASPGIVLIDGRFRIACFLASMIYAHAGTIILFDDYTRAKRGYAAVEQFLEPDQIIERMAVFTVPETIDRLPLAIELARRVTDPT